MEEREDNSACKAINLIKAFEDSFYKISYTLHPYSIAGEAPGKSSNESWAARQAFKDYSDEIKRNIIVTIMDGEDGNIYEFCWSMANIEQPIHTFLVDTSRSSANITAIITKQVGKRYMCLSWSLTATSTRCPFQSGQQT